MRVLGLNLLMVAALLAFLSYLGSRIDSTEEIQIMRAINVGVGLMAGTGLFFLCGGRDVQATRKDRVAAGVGAICLCAFISGSLIAFQESVWIVRTASPRIETTNNLKQLALAMHGYHDEHKKFPAAAICDKNGKPLLSWRVAILPYVEQKPLFDQFNLDEPWDSEHNINLLGRMPQVFVRPLGSAKPGETHYRVFVGGGAGFEICDALRFKDIKDGTGKTIMIVEAAESVPWTKPDELVYDPNAPLPELGASSTKSYFIAAFFDGHVQILWKPLAAQTVRALITRAADDDTGGIE
jgi:hypothetical protein